MPITFLESTAPTAPATGKVSLFVDSADGVPKYVDDTGAVHSLTGGEGSAATITPGTTTTLDAGSEATVTNSGTTSAAVFDFGIPKGDKGDQGISGSQTRSLIALGNVSGAITVDLSSADVITMTLTGATTFTWSGAPASGYVLDCELRISQDATGGRVATWPASGKWPGGAAFVLTTSASALDITGISIDSAGNWTGYPVEAIA